MGAEQSTLKKNGFVIVKEVENAVVATKGDETFLIKKISLPQTSGNADSEELEFLKTTNHPHIVSSKNSFQEDNDTYYVVMDYCQGGSLAAKIREMGQPLQEDEVLNWIVEICVALRTIHDKGLLHKRLTPENVFFSEFGTVCLGGFGKIHENSKRMQSPTNLSETLNYLAPEVFTGGTYDAKSDIWSVGCILYELCTGQQAFSAETTIKLIPKIIVGPYPSLPEKFSPELCQLLNDILTKDPQSRPTASEILGHPFIINCLTKKCETTVKELQARLHKLRGVADDLERVHQGATIGSLTGGVIGAAGGITSIVGLALAPFTMGASLIVTGVGVGVAALGGVTAGASNITNMVNQSSDRKAVRSFIAEIKEKMHAIVTWLQEISSSLQTLRSLCDTPDSKLNQQNLLRLGCRAGKGLGGIAELVRLIQVMNIGKTAAQASRVVRVAEVATGVLSGLFVAVDLFFIAMDAKELHHITQAKAEGGNGAAGSETETDNLIPPIKSEIMKFAQSIRQAADNLQEVVDELKSCISSIPSLGDGGEQGWRDMELM